MSKWKSEMFKEYEKEYGDLFDQRQIDGLEEEALFSQRRISIEDYHKRPPGEWTKKYNIKVDAPPDNNFIDMEIPEIEGDNMITGGFEYYMCGGGYDPKK